MSILALLLPPRERLGARSVDAPGAGALRLPAEWRFVFSQDGTAATQTGVVATGLIGSLPRADHVVLVLADADVSWHRVTVPKAPAARLRAALGGVMEETLLDDDETLHFALAADAVPGRAGWVAVTHRPRLAAALAVLEEAGLTVEKVVAGQAPLAEGAASRGHFFGGGDDDEASPGTQPAPWLTLARSDGVVTLRTGGALARALLPDPAAGEAARWTATAAASAAAERWLGAPVGLLSDGERALEAAASPHNLRQFDLVARHRGTRALREAGKRLLSSEWRPVRLGLAALVGLQLVGLNAYAWQQRQALAAKRGAMETLLRTAHPGVRAVLDPALQMQRETERLRTAAGRPGEGDFEALLGAVAAAWPEGQGPVQTLRFEPGRLSFAAPGFGEPQLGQLRERLKPVGYAAELIEGRVTVARSGTAGAAPGAGR